MVNIRRRITNSWERWEKKDDDEDNRKERYENYDQFHRIERWSERMNGVICILKWYIHNLLNNNY